MVIAVTNCSVAAEHIQNALAKRRALGVSSKQASIHRRIDAGELPADADAAALANFYAAIYQGMSMQAEDGVSRDSLMQSAHTAMRARLGAHMAVFARSRKRSTRA